MAQTTADGGSDGEGELNTLSSTDLGRRTVAWLLDRGWAFYALWVLIISLVKYGIGILPSWNYMQAIALNWLSPHSSVFMTSPADFRLASPVSAVLAGWLHLTTGIEFLGFHFVLTCVALVIPLTMPAVRQSARLRLLVGILIIGSAVPAVLLSWIGSYDPVSIAAAAVAGLARRPWVAFLGWFVFAFNNAPQALVGACVYGVVVIADDRGRAGARILAAVSGVMLGYLGVRLLIWHWGGSTGPLTIYKLYGFFRYFDDATSYWPLIFLSALGVGWMMVVSREVRSLAAAKALFVMAVVASVVVPLVAVDETRITAGALWAPMLLTAAIIVRRVETKRVDALLRRLLPVAVILVIVVVWDGSLVYAGWHGAWNFVNYILGRQPIPTIAAS
jgi:hypothetical protein